MNIDEFYSALQKDINDNKESFILNAKSFENDMSFCDWIEIFSAWMEWLEGDCEEYHD